MGMADMQEEMLTRGEAEEFITSILCEEMPKSYPPQLPWINRLIQSFQRRIPYQNVSFLSQGTVNCVPTWKDIRNDVIKEGKGGLCLTLNVALAAVLRAVGIWAYTAAADYVATRAIAVHVVVIIDLNKKTGLYTGRLRSSRGKAENEVSSEDFPCKKRKNSSFHSKKMEREGEGNQSSNSFKESQHPLEGKSGLHLADVGCGYPTLRTVNLKDDLGRIFLDCGLEYCFVKKGHQFLRMHRKRNYISKGEEVNVNSEDWKTVFSFNLTPRGLGFFDNSMKVIYVDKEKSPYFEELHAISYKTHCDMIAIKNEELITCKENFPRLPSDSSVDFPVTEFRKKLRRDEILEVFINQFPMIPRSEVDIALQIFF